MSEQVNEVLVNGLLLLIPLVVAVVAQALRGYLVQLQGKAAAELGQKNWTLLTETAVMIVRAGDQYRRTLGYSNEQVKLDAVQQLVQWAARMNIPITPMDADTIIEGVLNAIRKETAVAPAPESEPEGDGA
jgi:hypothetical protein